MIMKKSVYLWMCLLLMFGLFSACSSDDNATDEVRSAGETSESVSFNLFHEDGGESLIFQKGEPLVFQLAFKTPGNPIFSKDLKEDDLIADQGLFTIYKENGEKVGQPQLDRIDLTAYETVVGPYVFSYTWSAQNGDVILEPGNYYTQFSIMYNAKVGESGKQMERKDIKVNFKIQ